MGWDGTGRYRAGLLGWSAVGGMRWDRTGWHRVGRSGWSGWAICGAAP